MHLEWSISPRQDRLCPGKTGVVGWLEPCSGGLVGVYDGVVVGPRSGWDPGVVGWLGPWVVGWLGPRGGGRLRSDPHYV